MVVCYPGAYVYSLQVGSSTQYCPYAVHEIGYGDEDLELLQLGVCNRSGGIDKA